MKYLVLHREEIDVDKPHRRRPRRNLRQRAQATKTYHSTRRRWLAVKINAPRRVLFLWQPRKTHERSYPYGKG